MEERREGRSLAPGPALLNLPGPGNMAGVEEINIFTENTDRELVTASNTEIIEKERRENSFFIQSHSRAV